MSAHTPGPWRVVDDLDGFRKIEGPGGEAIAYEPIVIRQGSPQTGTWVEANGEAANLALIATAPDLLRRLKHRWQVHQEAAKRGGFDECSCDDCKVDLIVIAKAKGRRR